MIRSLVFAALALFLALGPAAHAAEAAPNPSLWRPALDTRWQVQYSSALDAAVAADAFKLDLFDAGPDTLQSLKQRGKRAVCYVNIGAWEDWRPDAARFHPHSLGRDYDGWPGERWLDIRHIERLKPVMLARLDLCKSKGFDGVLFDNIDSYQQKTGFRITRSHQLRYVLWIAAEAHKRGLAVGINNNPEQAKQLVPHVEWAQAESCFSQGWCASLKPYIAAGKPVMVIEYTDEPDKIAAMCRDASSLKINLMVKKRELDAFRRDCSEVVAKGS